MQSTQINAFQQAHQAALNVLSQHIALMIYNTQLQQQASRHEHLAEALYNIGRALARPMSQQQVLDLILHQLATVIPHERGTVMLRNSNNLEMVATRGFPANQPAFQWRIPIRAGDVFDEICQTQRPLVLTDALQRANWFHIDSLLPARSWMGIPLIHDDEVIGMLSIARETHTPYTEDEITFATTFAIQAVIALEKAYLYDQLDHLVKELDPNQHEQP